MKHLFNIYLKVIKKTETIEFPEGMSHFLEANNKDDLYFPYSSYEHLINFRTEKAFILFMPLERMEIKELIFNLIEETYGYTREDLKIKTRKEEIVLFRFVFYYLMKKNTKLSLASIGSITNQDYTSVLRGVNEIKNILEVEKGWRNEYANNIIDKFNNQTNDKEKRCTTQGRS